MAAESRRHSAGGLAPIIRVRCRVQRPVGWRATIKLERDAGRKGLPVGGQRYKPVTKGRISAETVKKYIEEQKN